MNELLRKKINLLVHLARIDGKLDQSEKDTLMDILKEHNIHDFNWNGKHDVDLNDFDRAPSRSDILYLALRMVRADGVIHPDEAAYCKALAIKLEFNPDIIDRYTKSDLPVLDDFKQQAKAFHL